MKTIFLLFLSLIISIGAMAQKDISKSMKALADDGVVIITFNPAGDDAAVELKAAIEKGMITLTFEPPPGSDVKVKEAPVVETKIESSGTDKADFDNMKGIVELKVSYKVGDVKYLFTGNLSLSTLKGMGNLGVMK